MADLLKSFVIGSSAFVFLPFYFAVKSIPESKINLLNYTIRASLYFGIMNMIATIIGKQFGLTLWDRLFIINIISIIIIWVTITLLKPYDFKTTSRWILQYILVAIFHSFTYLFTIYNLEKIFSS